MTLRGGKKASKGRSEIGEDKRQPVMARLTARWRRSNLIILVTLKKGNHPGKVYVTRGPKKSFIQKREGLLRGTP